MILHENELPELSPRDKERINDLAELRRVRNLAAIDLLQCEHRCLIHHDYLSRLRLDNARRDLDLASRDVCILEDQLLNESEN